MTFTKFASYTLNRFFVISLYNRLSAFPKNRFCRQRGAVAEPEAVLPIVVAKLGAALVVAVVIGVMVETVVETAGMEEGEVEDTQASQPVHLELWVMRTV